MDHQTAYDSYMHAMSSDVWSKFDACNKFNSFISEMMAQVDLGNGIELPWISVGGGGKNRDPKTALGAEARALGYALHAAMDFTSPSHSGFQRWSWDYETMSKHGDFPGSLEKRSRAPEFLKETMEAMQSAEWPACRKLRLL